MMFESIVSAFDLEKLAQETEGQPDQGAVLYDYAWTSTLYHMATHTTAGFSLGLVSSLLLFKSISRIL